MDFANFVQNYLNQQTEGDPSFMVSDEALAFVDLMRKDDMDRRASGVPAATSANERGEPTNEQVTDEHVQDAHTTDGAKADTSVMFQEYGEDTTPAETVSEVALGAEPLLASSSLPDEVVLFSPFHEPGEDSESTPPAQEVNEDASAIDLFFEQGYDPEPSGVVSEQHQDAEQTSQESLDLFSHELADTDSNEALQSEGVNVTDIPNLSGETTFIVPEGMPDFDDMIRTFDRDYRPPDLPVGDLEIPDVDDSETIGLGDLQNTSEFAESMIAGMGNNILETERSAP